MATRLTESAHVRGGATTEPIIRVVSYSDFLCPYCRRFRTVLKQLRNAFGERLEYVFRHFPNERVHPGANFAARAAEAAANQGRFWEMHDRLFDEEPSFGEPRIRELARDIGLDMARFERDLIATATRQRIESDLVAAQKDGVTGTPTIFIDGMRYDGAWDFYSLADAFDRPVSERLRRSANAFANLPASGGIALLIAAGLALVCANSPLAASYYAFFHSTFGIGPPGSALLLTIGDWCSEGLLALFFLLVGLEIRREMTAGGLSDFRVALLPAFAALGGGIVPALIYLIFNRGPTAPGWSVPTATDIAFVLGVLALLGARVPSTLRVFAAAFAVIDDVLSVLTLAVFYPRNFEVVWLAGAALTILAMVALNRARVYSSWPYVLATAALWFFLHSAGVHGALAGVALAALVPTRPPANASYLLAQAANALTRLEHAQRESDGAGQSDEDAVLEWASRNLSAASERLLSPADRLERAVAPWSTYLALPLFAFSATGISFDVNWSTPGALDILLGVIVGLVVGKPLGICLTSLVAIKGRVARAPKGVGVRAFIGTAFLCGIGDTVALLMADQAFSNGDLSAIAKIGVLIGSILAALFGVIVIASGPGGTLGDGEQTPA